MKRLLYIFSSCLALMLLMQSCISRIQDQEAYQQWYQENQADLVSDKQVGSFQFQLSYLPSSILLMQEYGEAVQARPDYDSLLADRAAFDYYALRIYNMQEPASILTHSAWNIEDYQHRIQYLAFDMQQDIKLLSGSDTTACALYHFERSYDVKPYTTLMLAFPAQELSSTFLYDDQIWGLGPVMFATPKLEHPLHHNSNRS